MDNCGSNSQGHEVRAQEKSIITPANEREGATSKQNWKKWKENTAEQDDALRFKAVYL